MAADRGLQVASVLPYECVWEGRRNILRGGPMRPEDRGPWVLRLLYSPARKGFGCLARRAFALPGDELRWENRIRVRR
jgi:hypothetical protein